uniref:Maturation n=1 Tax=Leviviridae sp. TaxID=2027243 RepID=A0A514D8F4_9VIRU|nr:MAG: hypothetical protein H1Bulk30641_000003 [Leviviridae sp.]
MAFVTAHTNRVGTWVESELREERIVGSHWDVDTRDQQPVDDLISSYAITTAVSRKPPTYKGDHKSNYDYWRGVNRVTKDIPYILHDHYVNPVDGQTSNYDYLRNEFISLRHTPFSASPVHPLTVENAWNESIVKALLSLQGKSAELGNDLGELKTTVEALASDVMKAANFIRHMKKGRWRKAADDLGLTLRAFNHDRGKTLANYWLSYSYGWKPLAQSMYDIQSSLAEEVARRSRLIEGHGTARVNGHVEFPYNDFEETGDWAASCKTTLKASISDNSLRLISKFGLTNPAAVAWELVPFSFVVDWFIPVGNTLQAMTAAQGLTFVGGWTNQLILEEVNIKHKFGYMTPWTDCVDAGHYQERSVGFRRDVHSDFPGTKFYADLTPYSSPRALNALALVRQLTK